jgi:Ca2+-binding RTX toxin-like protein
MRRAALAALAVLALVPATAEAGTTVTYSSTTGLRLEGNAAGDLTQVEAEPNRFVVNGNVPGGVVPGSGCETKSSIEVMCALGSNRFVTANLGDGDDEIRIRNPFSSAPPVDSLVNGGGGNDRMSGGKALDSFDGGLGDDDLSGEADSLNDVFEGGDGNDLFRGDSGGADTWRGEAGNDRFVARLDVGILTSPDLFDGGPGNDVADYSIRGAAVLLSSGPGAAAAPNDGRLDEGDDLDSVETLIGGSGGDTLEVRNTLLGTAKAAGTHTLTGNAGADTLRVVRALFSSLDGGAGLDTVTGGSARDVIFSREGEQDTITCGGDIDTLKPDLRDVPVSPDCENLDQSDRREGPNVALRNRLARVDQDGSLSVRLACPRSVRIGCRGALSARLERRGARFGAGERYSLRPGRSATVAVDLPGGQVAAARRRGARVRVRSVERGVHGPKTTQRSLPVRRE